MSGEGSLVAVKETSNKRHSGTKSKRSSEEGELRIQESSSEPDMEIEFENNDSGDDISDGDAECL